MKNINADEFFDKRNWYFNAFKDIYNYDDIDEKDFENPRVIEAINESIDDFQSDGILPYKEQMAEVVKNALFMVQYGDTDDPDELDQINEDMHNRFPDGR